MAEETKSSNRSMMLGGVVGALLFIGMLVWIVSKVMHSKTEKPARMVQNVTIIRPPPPPDEPPPPPPPPEKIDEPLPQDQPDPTPDNSPAPSDQLALDADASAGGDAFGLAAHKGGSDLVGGNGAAFAWYTRKVEDAINTCLAEDPKLRGKKYSATVRTRIGGDGRMENKLVGSSGDREVDNELSNRLGGGCRVSDAPPLELPQPVSLRIVSRA